MDQAPPASELQAPSGLAQNTVVSSSSGTANVPTGSITMYVSVTPPSGWLVCDGSSLNRTTYAALFAVIGTTYGTLDGASFSIPDLRGRVAVGIGTNASASVMGVSDGQTVANRRPHHRTSDAKTVSIGTLGTTNTLTLPDHSHHTRQETAGGGGSHYPNAFGASSGAFTNNDDAIDGVTSNPAINGSVTITGAPTIGGSLGTNNTNDALDTPSFLVVEFIIKT